MNPFSMISISQGLLVILVATASATVVLQLLLWKRQRTVTAPPAELSPVQTELKSLRGAVEQAEKGIRDEFSRLRQELAQQNQVFGNDLTGSLKSLNDSL